ncbi:MAG: MFS transporter [bacterium]|nr:MFS transporter [bacterium]
MRTNNAKKISKNIAIMYATAFFGGMLFFLPILALYFEKTLFTATNIAIIFTVDAFAGIIFEIPTGAIADLFGRKKNLIFSNLILLCALLFLYIGGSITIFIIYAILNALARTMASGTDAAILYDILKEEGRENLFKKIIGIYFALWPLGATIGSLAGGYLAKLSLQSTIFFSFIPITLVLFLTFFLREPKYEKVKRTSILRHMTNASTFVFKNKQLVILGLATFIAGGVGDTRNFLGPLFFRFKNLPLEYFGLVSALTLLLMSFGYYSSNYVSKKIGNKKTLVLVYLIAPFFIFAATITAGFPLVALWTLPAILFGLKNPIIMHLLNAETDSNQRATIISINSFMCQLGIVVIAPLFGYLIDLYNIQTAVQLLVAPVLLVSILFIFLKEKK